MITTLPKQLKVGNVLHDIRSDFRACLDIMAALNDECLSYREKAIVTIYILYVHPEDITDYNEAYKQAMWFLSCGEESTENQKPMKLVIWERDFSMMVGEINKCLGFECRACDYLHWWTFVSAYMEMGECSYRNVLSIRYKKATGKKLEKWEEEFYRHNRSKIDIPIQYNDGEKELLQKLGLWGN